MKNLLPFLLKRARTAGLSVLLGGVAVVFNSMGQQVDVIYEGEVDANKTLSYNKPLAKGLYFVRIQRASSAAETLPFAVQ